MTIRQCCRFLTIFITILMNVLKDIFPPAMPSSTLPQHPRSWNFGSFIILASNHVLAMPSSASSAAVALVRPAASSVIASPNAPPQPAICAQSLGQVNSDECNAATATLPRNASARPTTATSSTKLLHQSLRHITYNAKSTLTAREDIW